MAEERSERSEYVLVRQAGGGVTGLRDYGMLSALASEL